MISKIAAYYAEDVGDQTVLSAVDQIEDLTTSLNQKIWNKAIRLNQGVAAAPATSQLRGSAFSKAI